MRVAMYYSNRDVRLVEMPIPEIGPGEILVRVEASGICGSDVMEWYRKDRVPLVLGHEIGGTVAAVGAGVTTYKEGDRITASHHVPCNTCHYCLHGHHTMCETLRRTHFDPGGFAEYLRLPAINVDRGTFRLPEDVSFEEATFAEPLACVLRGQRLAGFRPGQTVVVLGSGVAGLLHIHLAHALGAGRILATDVSDYRLKAARHLGADEVMGAEGDVPARLRELNDGRLADLVIVCTGATPALLQGLQSVDMGGTILLFAPTGPGVTLPLNLNDIFWRRDVTITTTYAGAPGDFVQALELIRLHRVRVADMITHRLPMGEIGRGFELVADPQDSIKVIVHPHR